MKGDRDTADIAVVIPTLGRPEIASVISAVADGSVRPQELIIVDQSSNPAIEAMVRVIEPAGVVCHFLPSDRSGRAAAVNDGLSAVSAAGVAIVDDDCVPAGDWLENAVMWLERLPGHVLTGRVRAGPGEGHVPSLTTGDLLRIHSRPLVRRDVLYGGNMAAAMTTIRRIGSFDERRCIRHAEDNDWAYRALRLGVPITFVPEMVVTHKARDDLDVANTYRGYARSQGGLYGKYMRKGDRFMALRAFHDLLRGPWVFTRGVMQEDPVLRSIGLAYIRHLLAGIVDGLLGCRGPKT